MAALLLGVGIGLLSMFDSAFTKVSHWEGQLLTPMRSSEKVIPCETSLFSLTSWSETKNGVTEDELLPEPGIEPGILVWGTVSKIHDPTQKIIMCDIKW